MGNQWRRLAHQELPGAEKAHELLRGHADQFPKRQTESAAAGQFAGIERCQFCPIRRIAIGQGIGDKQLSDEQGESRPVAAGVVKLESQIRIRSIGADVESNADLPPEIQSRGRRQRAADRRRLPRDRGRGIFHDGPSQPPPSGRLDCWRSTRGDAPARCLRPLRMPPDPNTPKTAGGQNNSKDRPAGPPSKETPPWWSEANDKLTAASPVFPHFPF